jgi:hypothetical protein
MFEVCDEHNKGEFSPHLPVLSVKVVLSFLLMHLVSKIGLKKIG